MAITAKPYGTFLHGLGTGQFNLTTAGNVGFALVASGYTPNYLSDEDDSDYGTFEVADQGISGGYGGPWTFQNTAWAYNSTTGVATLSGDPVDYTTLSATFRYGLVIYTTGNLLIGCVDFGSDQSYTSQPFTYAFPDGIINIAAG